MRGFARTFLPTLALAIILGAFMAADRLSFHLYVPDEEETTDLQSSFSTFQLDLGRYLRRLDNNVQDASARADDARSETDDLRSCVNGLQVYIYEFPYGEIDGSC